WLFSFRRRMLYPFPLQRERIKVRDFLLGRLAHSKDGIPSFDSSPRSRRRGDCSPPDRPLLASNALVSGTTKPRQAEGFATLTCGACTPPPLFANMRSFINLAPHK